MTAREITHLALDWRLAESDGKTPHTAMRARLYTDMKQRGRESPFLLTAPGRFALKEWSHEIGPLTQTSSYLRAAAAVLERDERPMTAKAIVREAKKLGLLESSASDNTMRARLSMNVAQNREASTFARTAANNFVLREWIRNKRFDEYKSKPFAKELRRGQRVLVLPQSAIDAVGRFQGVSREWKPYLDAVREESGATYLDRVEAENSDGWKQVLTYVLVTLPDGRYVAYRRGSYSNIASFLAGQRCLGFGGHVDEGDRGLFTLGDWGIRSGAERELREEMEGDQGLVGQLEPIGVLNDDSSPVGVRHFAFLFKATLSTIPDTPQDLKGEWDVNELSYVSVEDVEDDLHSFEYWSQLCALQLMGAKPGGARVKRRSSWDPSGGAQLYVIAGEIASGKSEVSRTIAAELDIPLLSTREVVEGLLGVNLDEAKRAEFSDLAGQLVSSAVGVKDYATELVKRIREGGNSGAVIDGLRHPGILEELRKAGLNPTVVYVQTLPDVALRLYQERRKTEVSVEEFRTVRQHSVERQIPLIAPKADLVIYNFGTLESLQKLVAEELR